MSWFQLETSFPTHPKVVGLTDKAFRLHVCALAYCADNLTDGEIDPKTLRVLGANANLTRPKRVAETLVTARLWDVNPDETGSYRIHDYQQHQRTKADVERDRAAARERMRRLRSSEPTPNGSSELRPHVRQQIRSSTYIEKSLRPKGNSGENGAPTSQVVSKIEAYVRTVAINYPDERILREDLQDRFKQATPQDVEQGIQLWRQLTGAEAEQTPEGLAS